MSTQTAFPIVKGPSGCKGRISYPVVSSTEQVASDHDLKDERSWRTLAASASSRSKESSSASVVFVAPMKVGSGVVIPEEEELRRPICRTREKKK